MYTQSRLSMLNNRETKKKRIRTHVHQASKRQRKKKDRERNILQQHSDHDFALYNIAVFFMCNGYEFANSNKEDDNNNKNISN